MRFWIETPVSLGLLFEAVSEFDCSCVLQSTTEGLGLKVEPSEGVELESEPIVDLLSAYDITARLIRR
jgi:hypothetical protein